MNASEARKPRPLPSATTSVISASLLMLNIYAAQTCEFLVVSEVKAKRFSDISC